MNKRITIFITVIAFVLLAFGISFAFFTASVSNTSNQVITIEAGTMALTFTDNNGGIVAQLAPDESTDPKELKLTNTGNQAATATIEWHNLNNEYMEGSLTFTLKRKTSLTGTYETVKTGTVPSGVHDTYPIYTEKDMPTGAAYYYQVIIKLENLENINQNADIDAMMKSSFILVSGDDMIYDSKGFASDSWDKVITNVKAGRSEFYSVGDTKCLALNDYTTTNSNGCSNGEFLVRVANNSTPAECSTEGFSQTACGFVLEFVDIITTHNMNPAGEYLGTYYSGGWNKDGYPASSMKTFLTTELITKFPTNLQNAIIETPTVSSHGYSDTSNFTSNETLYLLAPREIYGTTFTSSYDTSKDVTRQLDYYQYEGVTTSNYSGAIKNRNGKASTWWTRSASSSDDGYFHRVNYTGGWDCNYASTPSCTAPAFRI